MTHIVPLLLGCLLGLARPRLLRKLFLGHHLKTAIEVGISDPLGDLLGDPLGDPLDLP